MALKRPKKNFILCSKKDLLVSIKTMKLCISFSTKELLISSTAPKWKRNTILSHQAVFFWPQQLDFREFTIQMNINLFYSIQEDVNNIIPPLPTLARYIS